MLEHILAQTENFKAAQAQSAAQADALECLLSNISSPSVSVTESSMPVASSLSLKKVDIPK